MERIHSPLFDPPNTTLISDISVHVSHLNRGSWGRSPCSDPTAVDATYRPWCRDNVSSPNDGRWVFGFANPNA